MVQVFTPVLHYPQTIFDELVLFKKKPSLHTLVTPNEHTFAFAIHALHVPF